MDIGEQEGYLNGVKKVGFVFQDIDHSELRLSALSPSLHGGFLTKMKPLRKILKTEAPRASARSILGKAKRNCAEATRLRPAGFAAVTFRHSSPCFRTGHHGEGEWIHFIPPSEKVKDFDRSVMERIESLDKPMDSR
jgi:hypothetical protein